ncbi:ATP-dependent RNA helicase DDX24 [Trichoplax sp. H2]|nr:ATP-dependent RNA helicase DDX24 [Trichoplax sp. H2]|eukprot:RDD47845.1 ATP-dependent RNA helicase DDX24 [Trichoplax sp. H2]
MTFNIKGKWQSIAIDCEEGIELDQLQGLVSFEELTDYTITDGTGKVSEVTNRSKNKSVKKAPKKDANKVEEESTVENPHDDGKDNMNMKAWDSLQVPEPVLKALSDMNFLTPTPIQSLSLVAAIRDRKDIIGAAETGSGKTLAYGIPIIQRILQLKADGKKSSKRKWDKANDKTEVIKETPSKKRKHEKGAKPTSSTSDQKSSNKTTVDNMDNSEVAESPVYALVLTPTRELALQVRDHLRSAAKYTDLKIEAIVGGISQHKQQRLLNYQPEIIIATPGRMWQLLSEGESHLQTINKLPLLVLDEVDRMIEYGHYAELSDILERLPERPLRQTLVYSATLTINKNKKVEMKKSVKKKLSNEKTFDALIEKLKLDKKVKVINLIEKDITVETLVEARINCMVDDKLSCLYLFCLLFPGKTLVFANSVSCIKKVVDIFRLLEQPAYPLHAKMQQRQRLKNLDRFKSSPSGILFCTDVAARGIDIKDIKYVIHFELPKAAELYVHRCGRTARAASEGMSIALLSPRDIQSYRNITKVLNRDIPEFPLDRSFERDVKRRMVLAERIVSLEKTSSREKSRKAWLKTAAEALDVTLNDEIDLSVNARSENENSIKLARKMLTTQLKLPLTTRNFSGNFPATNEILSTPRSDDPITPNKDDSIAGIEALKKKNKRKTAARRDDSIVGIEALKKKNKRKTVTRRDDSIAGIRALKKKKKQKTAFKKK